MKHSADAPLYRRFPRRTATACLLALFALCAAPVCLVARDYYVHHQIGSDRYDGSSPTVAGESTGPFGTILHAMKTATAGDTVHLVPTDEPYRESVRLLTHPTWGHPGGSPEAPLVIDGHGAIVSGAEPCPTDGWELWKDRIYRRSDFPDTRGLIVDGERVHAENPRNVLQPGDWFYFAAFKHIYYRPDGELEAIEALFPDGDPVVIPPGDWKPAGGSAGALRVVGLDEPEALLMGGETVPAVRLRDRLEPGEFQNEDGVVYYHLPDGKALDELEIECVVRQNGVAIAGSTAHVIVRNLHAQRVYNDGFNIHQGANNLRFENILATQCFDEGFSAHTNTETEIDGAVFLFNASGLTNVHNVVNKARNLIVAYNDGIGYVSKGKVREEVENLILIDNGAQLGAPFLTARNVVSLVTTDKPGGIKPGRISEIEGLTALGPHRLRVDGTDGEISILNSVFAAPGEWHFRLDDPAARLGTIEGVYGHPEMQLSYGANYPFKREAWGEWFAQHFPGKTEVRPFPPVADFLSGKADPEALPAGASPQLLERALELHRRHEAGEDIVQFFDPIEE